MNDPCHRLYLDSDSDMDLCAVLMQYNKALNAMLLPGTGSCCLVTSRSTQIPLHKTGACMWGMSRSLQTTPEKLVGASQTAPLGSEEGVAAQPLAFGRSGPDLGRGAGQE